MARTYGIRGKDLAESLATVKNDERLPYEPTWERGSVYQKTDDRLFKPRKALVTVVTFRGLVEKHEYQIWERRKLVQSGGFAHGISLEGRLMFSFDLEADDFTFRHYLYRNRETGLLQLYEPIEGRDY